MNINFFSGFCDENEYRLTKHLLDGYDAGVRPAKNASQPMVVVFGLSLHHIIDVVIISFKINIQFIDISEEIKRIIYFLIIKKNYLAIISFKIRIQFIHFAIVENCQVYLFSI